jgi:hypothetical protein
MTVQTHELKEAADHLHKAAELLYSDISYTTIELLAAFNRGIATITEPVSKRKLPLRPDYLDEPPQSVDDGGCDPLYGLRMDSADLGEC